MRLFIIMKWLFFLLLKTTTKISRTRLIFLWLNIFELRDYNSYYIYSSFSSCVVVVVVVILNKYQPIFLRVYWNTKSKFEFISFHIFEWFESKEEKKQKNWTSKSSHIMRSNLYLWYSFFFFVNINLILSLSSNFNWKLIELNYHHFRLLLLLLFFYIEILFKMI